MEVIRYWDEIPSRFYSDLTAKPFEHCLLCDRNLIELDLFYIIEKAYHSFGREIGEKTLFEYAICLDCAESYRDRLSKLSLSRMDARMSEVDFGNRSRALMKKDLDAWLEKCLIHEERVGENGEAQIYGLCKGDQFCYGEFPYMIRAEAMDEMVKLLSAETLDELEDFKNNLTDGPSELKDILDKVGPRLIF